MYLLTAAEAAAAAGVPNPAGRASCPVAVAQEPGHSRAPADTAVAAGMAAAALAAAVAGMAGVVVAAGMAAVLVAAAEKQAADRGVADRPAAADNDTAAGCRAQAVEPVAAEEVGKLAAGGRHLAIAAVAAAAARVAHPVCSQGASCLYPDNLTKYQYELVAQLCLRGGRGAFADL